MSPRLAAGADRKHGQSFTRPAGAQTLDKVAFKHHRCGGRSRGVSSFYQTLSKRRTHRKNRLDVAVVPRTAGT